ncbi:hypothetical protein KA344_10025 [bacterium]|nr:hypothetical protein [bacterium]
MSGSRFSRFHRTIFRLSPILLVFVTYFHGLPDGLASSPRQKLRYQENEPTEGPEPVPAPVVAPVRKSAAPVKLIEQKPVAAAVLPVDNREEKILDIAFKKLKGQDVQGAIRALNQLTKEFPDNPDYALLYRMALRRQEAQQWYRYQDWVEQKHSKAKPFMTMTEPLRKESNQPGRINELKRATWVVLATGKYPSPEPARKVIVEPDSEDLEAK